MAGPTGPGIGSPGPFFPPPPPGKPPKPPGVKAPAPPPGGPSSVQKKEGEEAPPAAANKQASIGGQQHSVTTEKSPGAAHTNEAFQKRKAFWEEKGLMGTKSDKPLARQRSFTSITPPKTPKQTPQKPTGFYPAPPKGPASAPQRAVGPPPGLPPPGPPGGPSFVPYGAKPPMEVPPPPPRVKPPEPKGAPPIARSSISEQAQGPSQRTSFSESMQGPSLSGMVQNVKHVTSSGMIDQEAFSNIQQMAKKATAGVLNPTKRESLTKQVEQYLVGKAKQEGENFDLNTTPLSTELAAQISEDSSVTLKEKQLPRDQQIQRVKDKLYDAELQRKKMEIWVSIPNDEIPDDKEEFEKLSQQVEHDAASRVKLDLRVLEASKNPYETGARMIQETNEETWKLIRQFALQSQSTVEKHFKSVEKVYTKDRDVYVTSARLKAAQERNEIENASFGTKQAGVKGMWVLGSVWKHGYDGKKVKLENVANFDTKKTKNEADDLERTLKDTDAKLALSDGELAIAKLDRKSLLSEKAKLELELGSKKLELHMRTGMKAIHDDKKMTQEQKEKAFLKLYTEVRRGYDELRTTKSEFAFFSEISRIQKNTYIEAEVYDKRILSDQFKLTHLPASSEIRYDILKQMSNSMGFDYEKMKEQYDKTLEGSRDLSQERLKGV